MDQRTRERHRHRKWGHVFGGRYKAIVVENDGTEGGEYLTSLMDYVHLNPARAGLVRAKKGTGLLDYQWSSLTQGYAVRPGRRAQWLAVEEGLGIFGYADAARERRQFVARLEERAQEDSGEAESPNEGLQNTLQRGWYWGSQGFRERLLKIIKRRKGNRNYRSSKLGRAQTQQEGEEWLALGRKHFSVEGSLTAAPRAERVAIAWALHRKTNQKQAWIAEQLDLRSAANVSQQVRRFDQPLDAGARSKAVKAWVKFVKNC